MENKNCWTLYQETDLQVMESLCKAYMDFMDHGKTERECVTYARTWAKEHGFMTLEDAIRENRKLVPGDRVIATHMNKTAALIIIGRQPMSEGFQYVGAHIDSPRLDLKPNPMYEDHGLVYFDTHYYGGIKKYQWVALPLAIHGVVALKDGTVLQVNVGEDFSDPVFCVTDLLPHLAQNQVQKTGGKVVEGEDLDLLVGSRPDTEEEKDAAKKYILKLLKDKYGMEEDDFFSAELEVVPAGRSREVGFDRSMIMAYGHDDKSCAYPAIFAMGSLVEDCEQGRIPARTCVAYLADKEEVGSIGATGSHSHFFENVIAELCAMDPASTGTPLELCIRRSMQNSCVLSADVCSGFDPLYSSEFSKNNAANCGEGLAIMKYTGARGKSSANDANAEYLAALRRVFCENQVNFQMAEIGKVDHGGGGTIAYIVAAYGGKVVDCGVPVLSMHAPWELISKADLYEAYKAYLAFYRNEHKM